MAITGNEDCKETKTSLFKTKIPSRSKSPPKVKKASIANYVSDRSDRLYSSSIAGTSKFVRKLRQTSKKPTQIKTNDEVTFIFHGKKTRGIVRYTGSTYFSAGKWCGIELFEQKGNHNGSVKGHDYFTCADKFGIFLPQQKVSKISEKKVCKDDSDMKITFRSVRTNASKPILDFKNNKTENLRKKLDIKLNSISNTSESKVGSGKNIVVSAFVTPSPAKPIILMQDNDDVFEDDVNKRYDNTYFQNNLKSIDTNTSSQADEPFTRHESDKLNDKMASLDDGDSGVVGCEEYDTEESLVSPRQQKCDNNFSQLDSVQEDSHLSKIPRRISINSRKKDSEIVPTTEHDASDKNIANCKKLSENHNDATPIEPIKAEKVTTSIPRFQKSTLPRKQSLNLNKKGVDMKISSPVSHVPRFRSSSTSSKDNKQTILFSPSESGTSTPRKASKDSVAGSQNEDPSIVMGNLNASLHADTNTPNPIGVETSNVDDFQTKDVPGAVIIDKREKTKEIKPSPRKLRRFSDIKASPKHSKEQNNHYIADLENQLKERNQRITQLESDLQNNNQNVNDEKTINTQLQNEINSLSTINRQLNTKLEKSNTYISESNTRLEALSLVLQYYLHQVETQSENLEIYRTSKNCLSEVNKQLEENIRNLNEQLGKETSRKDELSKQIEQLKQEHANAVTKLQQDNEQQIKKVNKINEEQITKLTEKHKQEVSEIQEQHTKLIHQLNDDFVSKLEKSKKEIVDLEDRLKRESEEQLQEKENQHESKIETLSKQHEDKMNEFKESIDRLTNERNLLRQMNASHTNNIPNGNLKRSMSDMGNLPAELESLQAVLELKNEEVKNLRIKQMDLERKLDSFYELQSKCDSLAQQNQSLSESLKNKSMLERKVSVERDKYLERLESETKKVSRLSMEKEQLMWRASNPDLSYSSPNIFFEEDETDDPPSPLRSGSFTSTPKAHTNNSYKRRSMNFPISRSDYSLS